MNRLSPTPAKRWMKLAAGLLLVSGLVLSAPLLCHAGAPQQKTLPADSSTTTHRTRLIMKDGSYQVVMSYRVVGKVVHYISAERGGAEEEVPVALVDFDATHRWEKDHADPSAQDNGSSGQPPAIDPELLKEEADRASFTPEVATDLHLPEEDSTLILDTYHGTPELVPLAQTDSDLNRNTGHNVLRAAINPRSSAHKIVELKGETSAVQVHVASPVIYLRIGDEVSPPSGVAPLTVDTHGATSYIKGDPGGGSANSTYVIVRTDVRTDARVVDSFQIGLLGTGQRQEDVDETTTELLPGGHWMKITPARPLDFGEYALMEVISDKAVNLGVWDFGVHPVAPENRDAIKPEPKRPLILEHRQRDQN
jgi:hypothetical protein